MIECKLHMLLADKRMTQKELAEATGIGQNSISRYCNNTWVKFDKEHMEKLCAFFNCDISDLVTYQQTDEKTEYLKSMIEYRLSSSNIDNEKLKQVYMDMVRLNSEYEKMKDRENIKLHKDKNDFLKMLFENIILR